MGAIKNYLFIIISLGILTGCQSNQSSVTADPDVYYTCSMDPQVIAYKPGKCPICHMELTKVTRSSKDVPGEVQLSDQQMRLGNIRVDTIRQGSINDRVVLTATLNFDQMKTNTISARVAGRIDRLYFKNAGDYVQKGDRLFDLYSEPLNTAKQEYLAALEHQRTMDNSIVDFTQLVQSAKNKLLLWGMTAKQVQALAASGKANPLTTFYSTASGYITGLNIKDGDYVMEGGAVVTLADLSTLWAEAQVYASQLSGIDEKSIVTVQFPDIPGITVTGKIEFVNPEITKDTRINLVRVAVPNTAHRLQPGMPAYVFLQNQQQHGLTLPTDAVLRNGDGAMVWVQTGPHRFKSKMVQTGVETSNSVAIQSGLSDGEVVVTSGAYLLNSEYIFKNGSDPMHSHNMKM